MIGRRYVLYHLHFLRSEVEFAVNLAVNSLSGLTRNGDNGHVRLLQLLLEKFLSDVYLRHLLVAHQRCFKPTITRTVGFKL